MEVVVDLVEDLGSEAYVYTHAGSVSSWWRGAIRARRPSWPTRCGCAGTPKGVVHLFHPRDRRAHQLTVRAPEFRLRTPTPRASLALPWDRPLSEWNVPDVPLRDIAVGPSRHLVKFVDADDAAVGGQGHAARIAAKEYDVLRRLEEMGLPAVRPAGLVLQPEFDTAILVTRYLEGSWQYRRLFMRLPPDQPKHRARLLDAMAGLLVELHRHGVFWGDCSLANTLVLPRRPAAAGVAGRRRDLRGTPVAEPRAAQARPRDHGGERGRGAWSTSPSGSGGRRSCTTR